MNEADQGEESDGNEGLIAEIDKFAKRLGERVHSVRIIAVLQKPRCEVSIYTVGQGDIYSQLGATREFLMRQDEYSRIAARKDQNDD